MSTRPKKNLLDQVRNAIRAEHAQVNRIKRDIVFHDRRHRREIGERGIDASHTHLAVERNVAASTQNRTLSGIVLLFSDVLQIVIDPL